MAVHVNSKISLWVQTFHPTFYTSLTDKEEWLYTQHELDPEELAAAEGYFEDLQTAMDAWKAGTSTARSSLKPIVMRLVTYQMYVGRGMVLSSVTPEQLDAKQIFEMGGFITATLSRPVEYYDDMTTYVPPDPCTSAKLEADIALLEPTVWRPMEQAKVDAIESAAVGVVTDYNYKAMFEDVSPVGPGTPMTKAQTSEWIFITLNYKWAKDTFPAVNLTIPTALL